MPLQSIVITPNARGADGISLLSRQVARALPGPSAIVSLHDVGDAADAAIEGVPLQGAGGSRARFCRNVARFVPQCDRDTVIVCCHLHLAPAARVLACCAGRSIVVLCGIEAWVPLRAAERWALRSSQLVAISAHTARRFKEANPEFQDTEIAVVHPGLRDVRVDGGGACAGHAALIVGRMAADEGYKGHDVLIDVWPRVLKRHPDAVLRIVGEGTDRPRLEAKVAAAGLEARVMFEGRVDDERLAALYRQCRFFVMPSRDEGFGFVFLEAMRAGKACIAARGAASEIIRHGETGWLVDPVNPEDVGEAVERFFDDDDLCERLGAAGQVLFRKEFTDTSFQLRLAGACGLGLVTR
jgi:glycosyltransferase involved in cell wall biosynthesis